VGLSDELTDIDDESTVEKAFGLLSSPVRNCLPVYQSVDGGKRYTGMITMRGLAASTVFQKIWMDLENSRELKEIEEGPKKDKIRCEMMERHIQRVFKHTLKELLSGDDEHFFTLHTLKSSGTVLDLVNTMEKAIRHVLITEGDKAVNVLSQGNLVHWLSKQEWQDTDISLRKLWEMNVNLAAGRALKMGPVDDPNQLKYPEGRWTGGVLEYALHLPSNLNLETIYRSMNTHRLTSVAIVDPESGKLVGAVTTADLRHVIPNKVKDLYAPVSTFLRHKNKDPAVVEHNALLKDAVAACVEKIDHYAWIVKEGKPVGVVSLTDVIACLVPGEQEKAEE
jgi:CBS domain-containing protein